MLTRLRIQNYRSIDDLTLELGSKNLLMGLNGSGKSSVFDALSAIRELTTERRRCEEVFPLSSVPKWKIGEAATPYEQSFEIDFRREEGAIRYQLVLEQNPVSAQSLISSEIIYFEERPVFSFIKGKAQFFIGDKVDEIGLPIGRHHSILAIITQSVAWQVDWVKERLKNLFCLRVDATQIKARSENDDIFPKRDMSNLASWYRHMLTTNLSTSVEYWSAIQKVIGGIESLDLRSLGQGVMVLRAAFKPHEESHRPERKNRESYWLEFDELSDGQRALIALYALLYFIVQEDTTLCIDEPDNYLALAEIQPWLFELQDRVDDRGGQVLLASHHPELLNMLAPDYGIILERDGGGPTTARPFSVDAELALSPAEVVARGWERE